MTAMLLHRIHFALTVTCHDLFPQLTMGLALLIVVLKTIGCAGKMNVTTRRHFTRISRSTF